MIDFENGALWKLRKCDESAIGRNLRLLLIEGEQIIGPIKAFGILSSLQIEE